MWASRTSGESKKGDQVAALRVDMVKEIDRAPVSHSSQGICSWICEEPIAWDVEGKFIGHVSNLYKNVIRT